MIILLLGGIGSGKSLTIVKEILKNDSYAITNFNLNLPKNKYYRLKLSDFITIEKDEKGRTTKQNVNWGFWDDIRKKHKNFSIYLDEVHNLIHARSSMSKRNILMSKWISQVRKILSDDPKNHIYLISQTIRKIDVDFRELAQLIIVCQKLQLKSKVWIKLAFYDGLENYMYGNHLTKRIYLGNPYFKYYNTHEMVTFADADEFI